MANILYGIQAVKLYCSSWIAKLSVIEETDGASYARKKAAEIKNKALKIYFALPTDVVCDKNLDDCISNQAKDLNLLICICLKMKI